MALKTSKVLSGKEVSMRLLTTLGFLLIPGFALAQNVPQTLQGTTPQNILMSAGAVSDIFISASTVVTVTVPYFADTFVASGDNAWVCENPRRCGPLFPTSTVSSTGWIYNPSGRVLKGNLQVSTSYIYVYARPQDMVSTTAQNIVGLEWSKQ